MALDASRSIIEEDGVRGLSTRRLAKAIGYTPGTLYQLFADLDELIVEVNVETLDGLYAACEDVDFDRDTEEVLLDLALRYIAFTKERPRLWNALFEHALPSGTVMPNHYNQRVFRLLGLAEQALVPLFQDNTAAASHEARVLWSSLYGIASLASSNKMSEAETPEAIVRSLVTNYITGLRSAPSIPARLPAA
jgi:AcrR family transcriptional regulator